MRPLGIASLAGESGIGNRKRSETLGLPIQLWLQVEFELSITLADTRNVNKQPDADDAQRKMNAAYVATWVLQSGS